jgi:molybdenum cofactor cytidylyltransferase
VSRRHAKRAKAATTVVGVLLAAGSASRFGSDKLLVKLSDGRELAEAALASLAAAVDQVIAVVRPGDAALISLFRASGALVSICANAGDGMGASLACGVRELRHRFPQAQGVVIALADMPWVSVSSVERVVAALRCGSPLAAPTYRGSRGHPVAVGSRHFEALEALGGDEGARALLAAHGAELELIEVDDPGVLRDVDTPADLRF